jgi:hypothetical protein
VKLERGFRRITIAVSVGLFLVTAGYAPFFLYLESQAAAVRAAREVLNNYTSSDEDILSYLSSSPKPEDDLILLPSTGTVPKGSLNAARHAARGAWVTTVLLAITIIAASTLFPWGAFFLLRWIGRGFMTTR